MSVSVLFWKTINTLVWSIAGMGHNNHTVYVRVLWYYSDCALTLYTRRLFESSILAHSLCSRFSSNISENLLIYHNKSEEKPLFFQTDEGNAYMTYVKNRWSKRRIIQGNYEGWFITQLMLLINFVYNSKWKGLKIDIELKLEFNMLFHYLYWGMMLENNVLRINWLSLHS